MDTSRHEFNKLRKMFIQNVSNVSHQDVRSFLGNYEPSDIVVNKKFRHVIISLKNAKLLDEALVQLDNLTLKGQRVQVELYPRRMMLYISGLPKNFTRCSYLKYLAKFGSVETAVLGITPNGQCKGYGFVEFSHNRVTLENIMKVINGSTLEGGILYCGLVSQNMLTYEDTHSCTLYCIHAKEWELNSSRDQITYRFHHPYYGARIYELEDGRKLYINQFPNHVLSDHVCQHIWNVHNCNSSPNTCEVKYAAPCFPPEQIYQHINNTKMSFPSIEDTTEVRCLLLNMFSGDLPLVCAIEDLLAQMKASLGGQPLTITVIMNLAKLLGVDPQVQATALQNFPCADPPFQQIPTQMETRSLQQPLSIQVPDTSKPPPVFLPPARPVTRSQSSLSSLSSLSGSDNLSLDSLISAECQTRVHREANTTPDPLDELLNYGNTSPMAGPMTRQRRRTLERTPYSKTPGSKAPNYNKTPGHRPKKDGIENEPALEIDLQSALTDWFSCKQELLKSTPLAVRRLMPKPEASPGSPSLIGQHMQGFGGLYASSYIPSKKAYRPLW